MSKIWSKDETLWSFALYGTAVGAGTLFLPIQLGSAGAIVLFITALVAYPLTYWPHRALAQFILSSNTKGNEGITGAVSHYYGKKIGNLITTLYFIAFFVVVQIYAVAITNSLTEQLAKHLTVDTTVRVLVSLGVVLVLNLIFLMGRHITIKVMGFLVFPLIAYFLFVSIYLTGSWQPSLLTSQMAFDRHTLHQVWISIPVMVFAFSHTPIISTFAVDRREKFADGAMDKCKKIMKVAYLIICLSVLVLCLQLPALYPTVLYYGRQRAGGDDSVSAVDDAVFPSLARHFRDYRGDRSDVEIVPRHLFWGD